MESGDREQVNSVKSPSGCFHLTFHHPRQSVLLSHTVCDSLLYRPHKDPTHDIYFKSLVPGDHSRQTSANEPAIVTCVKTHDTAVGQRPAVRLQDPHAMF